MRREMMLGHLFDVLMPARELVDALRLQSNASVTTRSKLEHLGELAGSIWEHLGIIREEARHIRQLLTPPTLEQLVEAAPPKGGIAALVPEEGRR
jgi:hypothetical protein